MATTSQPVAAVTVNSDKHTLSQVGDSAEFVSLASVLTVLESLRVRDAALIRDAELDKKSEIPAKRERWEIFSGRCVAMSIAADEIRKLPTRPADDLMGGKPILSALETQRAAHSFHADGFAARCNDPMERNPDFVDREWQRHDAVRLFIDSFLKQFVGSAEEQPTPREESRPVMGTGIARDTGRGESTLDLSMWRQIQELPLESLETLSDALLDLVESRSGQTRWQSAS